MCRCIHCKGLPYPPTYPRSVITSLPIHLPLCNPAAEKTKLELKMMALLHYVLLHSQITHMDTHKCMHAHIDTHARTRTHTHTHTHVHIAKQQIHSDTQTHTHTHRQADTHTCTHTHTHKHSHLRTYTRTHTHTHTQ